MEQEKDGVRAVLFDMDGVVYDSLPTLTACWKASMAKFGIEVASMYIYAHEGMRGTEIIKALAAEKLGRDITDDEAAEMYAVKEEEFNKLPLPPVMPGIMELMGKVKAAGMRIVIVTGSGQRSQLAKLLDDFAVFVSAADVVCAMDVERGKPAPDPYLKGLERAGCTDSSQAVVVENAPLGLAAAKAAGIRAVAVNTGPLPDGDLYDAGAGVVFPSVESLAAEFEKVFMGERE